MSATVQVTHRDELTVARVDGEVDLVNAHVVAGQLLDGVSNDAAGLVVDLTAVRYIDSAGVRALFEVARRLQDSRRELMLVLSDASPVRRLLRVTNLDAVARVFASVEEAVAAVDGVEDGTAY